jgi:hypothetical protein
MILLFVRTAHGEVVYPENLSEEMTLSSERQMHDEQPLDLRLKKKDVPDQKNLVLPERKERDWSACQDLHLMIFTNSSHPGGNKDNRLNENNGGLEADCFAYGIRWRAATGKDSQFGDFIIVGAGPEFDIARAGPWTFRAGAFISAAYYEVRKPLLLPGNSYRIESDGKIKIMPRYGVMTHKKDIFSPLPSLSVGIGYKISEKWEIYLEQNILPDNIRLRSYGVRKTFQL